MNEMITIDNVRSRMVMLRGEAMLLDRDVAALYGVQTKEVNQAVRKITHEVTRTKKRK